MAPFSAVPPSRASFSQSSLKYTHLVRTQPTQQTTPPLTPPFDNQKDSPFDVEDNLNSIHATQFSVDPEEEPLVAVVGCGYVGSNLIGEFRGHYNVLGFDVSPIQIEAMKELHGGEGSRAAFTLSAENLSRATHFLVSVPTLLLADKSIDTSYIRSALGIIARFARRGSTVVIESSVAVGMTRQLLGPLALEKGLFAGMSPERVDPGRAEPPMHTITKIVSGLDDVVPGSLHAIMSLYAKVFDNVLPVSRPEVAEMTKLYENCQRMVCIAFANEMADACIPHSIDPYEVCRAAATKPFGYMPFTPSLGVGGHCIPINPYYLLSNSEFPLLKAATEKMWKRPVEIGQRILDNFSNADNECRAAVRPPVPHNDSGVDVTFDKMDTTGKAKELGSERVELHADAHTGGASNQDLLVGSVKYTTTMPLRARVLVVGVGFKAGQGVLSNSPGQKLLQWLADSGQVDVMFADPLVKQSAIPQIPRLDDGDWNKQILETFDRIIVSVKQAGVDFSLLEQLDGVQIEAWCA